MGEIRQTIAPLSELVANLAGCYRSPGSSKLPACRRPKGIGMSAQFRLRPKFAMEETMQSRLKLSLAAGAACLFLQAAPEVRAEGGVAITGLVTSDAEGAMEGVVVTARMAGAKFSVSVVTDAQGRYSFPANRLQPGNYALTIRAVGYDLGGKATADVAAEKTATADLKLAKTRRLSSQLTNAEWMASIPGTEEQKSGLLNCVSCHTLERIVRSSHDVDEWTNVIHRMMGYAAVSQPIKPRSEEHTSELQSLRHLVCRLLLE